MQVDVEEKTIKVLKIEMTDEELSDFDDALSVAVNNWPGNFTEKQIGVLRQIYSVL